MPVILGIDPGSRITGYGVISFQSGKAEYIDSGCIKMIDADLSTKLKTIYEGISDIIQAYQPTEAAVEQVFFHDNPNTALKLGQARGSAITAVAMHGVSFAEYSARQIKKAVVGYGAASKEQIQHMIKALLNLSIKPQSDAADALAIALCHAYTRQSLSGIKGISEKMRYGRVR